jgi:hypothetical protein
MIAFAVASPAFFLSGGHSYGTLFRHSHSTMFRAVMMGRIVIAMVTVMMAMLSLGSRHSRCSGRSDREHNKTQCGSQSGCGRNHCILHEETPLRPLPKPEARLPNIRSVSYTPLKYGVYWLHADLPLLFTLLFTKNSQLTAPKYP